MKRPMTEGIREGGARSVPLLNYEDFVKGVDWDEDFMTLRRQIMAKAEAGDEEALADLRDGYGLRTWIKQGKPLIVEGELVGAKR
jgi:hypothetical protein